MHPVLFELGSFPLGTYGLLLAIAFFAGTALAKRQGRLDGLVPAAITDLAIAMLISAIVGSKLLMIVVDLVNGRPFAEIFSLATLRAGGAIHGGIIAATAVFFWKLRKGQGLPLRITGDALVPGVALGQAIGRLGCFSAGCCWGRATSVPWAVTFTDVYAARQVGTPIDTALHPSQLYESFVVFLVFLFLLWLAPRKRFHGAVTLAYVALYSVARFVLEFWRGDAERGTWFGHTISTSQLIAIALLLGAAVALPYVRRSQSLAKGEAAA